MIQLDSGHVNTCADVHAGHTTANPDCGETIQVGRHVLTIGHILPASWDEKVSTSTRCVERITRCGEPGRAATQWGCTRPPGHPGLHVASTSYVRAVIAVWGEPDAGTEVWSLLPAEGDESE
jgi:hypothetical protein